jgi:hypothetical protein
MAQILPGSTRFSRLCRGKPLPTGFFAEGWRARSPGRRPRLDLRHGFGCAFADHRGGAGGVARVRLLDGRELRGLPAVGPLSAGSAIHGTEPGFGLFDE